MKNIIAKEVRKKVSVKVTKAEMSLILQQIDGTSATIISMIYQTVPVWRKTGFPLSALGAEKVDECVKLSKVVAKINVNYTNMVNNQREREGLEKDFVAQENWHSKKYDWVNGCIACNKNKAGEDQEYLLYSPTASKRLGFAIKNKEANPKQVDLLLPHLPASSTAKNQGTEVEVRYQALKMENLLFIKLKGTFYEVIQK
jgi:hypothetical protein